jgi:hypothetical protein
MQRRPCDERGGQRRGAELRSRKPRPPQGARSSCHEFLAHISTPLPVSLFSIFVLKRAIEPRRPVRRHHPLRSSKRGVSTALRGSGDPDGEGSTPEHRCCSPLPGSPSRG